MAIQIAKIDVWCGEIADRCGGLAQKIDAVAAVGANLEFVIARRAPDKPGRGLVFMAPLQGTAQVRAANAVGLAKDPNVHTLRLEGPNRPGFGSKITHAVAEAGISMRGLSATALGRRSVTYLAFDTDADARKAGGILKKAFANK